MKFTTSSAWVLICAAVAQACIYEYGSVGEAHVKAGGHFTYGYNGLDWVNDFEACRGAKQSPLLLPGMGAAAKRLSSPAAKSSFSYGSLTNPTIVNNGHTLQVSLPADFKSNVLVPIKGDRKAATSTSIVTGTGPVTGKVKATPAQFHFHARSEHIISGAAYPLEMHIVHFIKSDQLPACADPGCPAVLGVMLELTADESAVKPELRKLFEAMPMNEQESAALKGTTINLNNLLPKNMTYFTYEGSLTTPPCTEGVLWHVLAHPIKISQSLLTHYQEAVGDMKCEEKAAVATESGPTQESAKTTLFELPAGNKPGCHKLANGHNYRATQPVNGRSVHLAMF